jgi:hypothetical protein
MEPHELEEIELHSGDDFRLDPPEVVRKWRLVAVILVTALLLAFLSSFLVLLFLKEGTFFTLIDLLSFANIYFP